jgi:Uma2 family endonuclease
MAVLTKSLVDDLYEVEGKAEIVNGRIVLMPPTGDDPSDAAGEVFVRLHEYARQTGSGRAKMDNTGFKVSLPHRSFLNPDVSFVTAPRAGMKFIPGSPVFAVEVRSENDYGPKAEREMAAKRDDYFATGALVVWDVDLLSDDVVIRSYSADDPDNPRLFRRGEIAEAEPAVPGWRMPVDDLFA